MHVLTLTSKMEIKVTFNLGSSLPAIMYVHGSNSRRCKCVSFIIIQAILLYLSSPCLLSLLAPSTHVDMQRYRWPDYEMKLLEELQKQQHNARFCDTLLQTEGEDEQCGNL